MLVLQKELFFVVAFDEISGSGLDGGRDRDEVRQGRKDEARQSGRRKKGRREEARGRRKEERVARWNESEE